MSFAMGHMGRLGVLCAGVALLFPLHRSAADTPLPDLRPFVDEALLSAGRSAVPVRRAVRIDPRYLDISRLAWSEDQNKLIFFTDERDHKWGHLEDTDHIVGYLDLEARRARHAFFVSQDALRGYDLDLQCFSGHQAVLLLAWLPPNGTFLVGDPWPRFGLSACLLDLQERQSIPVTGQAAVAREVVVMAFVGGRTPLGAKEVRLPARIAIVNAAGERLVEADYPLEVYPTMSLYGTAVATPAGFCATFVGCRRFVPQDSGQGVDGWPLGHGVEPEYEDVYYARFPRAQGGAQVSITMAAAGHYGTSAKPPGAQWCRYPVLSPSGKQVAYLAYREGSHGGLQARVQELRVWGPKGDLAVDFVCELSGSDAQLPPGRYYVPVVRTEKGAEAVPDREAAEAGREGIRNNKYVYAFSPDEKTLAFVRGEWLWLADLSKLGEAKPE